MCYVDDDGKIVPEPGDALKMVYYFKAGDYGRYDRLPPVPDAAKVTWPQMIVNHITDSLIDEDDYSIDMLKRGQIYASMKYHAQIYLGLDGVGVQINPVCRAAPAVAGAVLFRDEDHEVNNLAFHIEIISVTTDLKGRKYKIDPKTGKPVVMWQTNPNRSDLSQRDGRLWLRVPDVQREALGDILYAVHHKCFLNPVNLFHGHYALSRGSHIDPGPEVIDALQQISVARFDLPTDFVPPAGDLKPLPYPIADNPLRNF